MTAISCLESKWGEKAVGHNTIGYHWIPGMPWSGRWLEARESMTGEVRRYRWFESHDECMAALHYLIGRSKNYAEARRAYEVARDDALLAMEVARYGFVDGFSVVYCSADPAHGKTVLGVMGEIRGVLGLDDDAGSPSDRSGGQHPSGAVG